MEELNFDEMRNQIALLKNKLGEQEIVNERLLRHAVRQRMSILNWQGTKSIICGLTASVCFVIIHQMGLVSLTFAVATVLLMLVCVAATIYAHWPVWNMNLASDNLHTVARKLARLKRIYQFWLHVVTPITIVPWLAWYCYDYLHSIGIEMTSHEGLSLVCCLTLGGITGTIIGYIWHRKAVNACEDIIRDIES